MRPVAATLALILIAAALPQFAAAQDDGVFFDPGGPSDKEYAMPHDQARSGGGGPSSNQGGGSGSVGGSGGGQATPQDSGSSDHLFGQGVTRAQRDRKRDQNGADGDAAGAGGGRENAVGLEAASADTDNAIGVGWFLAIAAAVALLGGAVAYIMRSRTRGPAT